MSKLLHTITRESDVGIWNNQTSTARIYNDKIIVGQPYVKWLHNSGTLAFKKTAIRNQKLVDEVTADMVNGCAADAWDNIFFHQMDYPI